MRRGKVKIVVGSGNRVILAQDVINSYRELGINGIGEKTHTRYIMVEQPGLTVEKMQAFLDSNNCTIQKIESTSPIELKSVIQNPDETDETDETYNGLPVYRRYVLRDRPLPDLDIKSDNSNITIVQHFKLSKK